MKSKTRVRALIIAAGIVITLTAFGAVAGFMVTLGRGFSSATEEVVFERDVQSDLGASLTPRAVVSREGVSLTDVFSDERVGRYSADTIPPDGVGLNVSFRWRRGTSVIKEENFSIPAWSRFEETSNEARRDLVKKKQQEFERAVAGFVGPVEGVSFAFAIAVDITEGVSFTLANRVRETVKMNTEKIIKARGNLTVVMYRIHDLSYQGERRLVFPVQQGDLEKPLAWLLEQPRPEKQSSILRGMEGVMRDMNILRKGAPCRFDVWTDGLENMGALSVYKKPELLQEKNWGALDGIARLAEVDARGLDVHLHPLPPQWAYHEELMRQGLKYLENRLTAASAKVVVETI